MHNIEQLYCVKIGMLLGRYTDADPDLFDSLTGSSDPQHCVSALLQNQFDVYAWKGMPTKNLYKILREAIRGTTEET